MKRTKKEQRKEIPRIEADASTGLSSAQVEERASAGWDNRAKTRTGKSYFRIVTDNVCTYFNLIWAIIIGVLIAVGAYSELLFSVVILANTALAIIDEAVAKHTVDKLSLVSAPRVRVVRDGEEREIAAEDIVRDDVVILSAGNQIAADCMVLDGKCEADESLLTGESDAIPKTAGDLLLAGGFLVSGGCRARAVRVGEDAYIQTLAAKAKSFKAPNSYLFRDINKIIKWIGILILPFSGVMFFNNYAEVGDVTAALKATTGSIEGMIPAGMFLLITVALSLGVIRLGRKRTNVKDPYSIEMLSRTDMLCLDKTGTITDGTMRVTGTYEISPIPNGTLGEMLGAAVAAQSDRNFTSDALAAAFPPVKDFPVLTRLPFSSQRKCSAVTFDGYGTYALGAPEFLPVSLSPELTARITAEAEAGRRVLLFAYGTSPIDGDTLPENMTPLALVMLEDHIRENAAETLRWFRENGVGVKIISGDNPVTVSHIAAKVGVENSDKWVSLEGKSPAEAAALACDYTVFGRVTPEQKHALVVALKAAGHVVSMTGDGVNDTMALKEADCSIAMASGSEAAAGVSNIVLLDNDFSVLPSVVREGRQVINNVEQSSTLFLMKTFFAITLSLLCVLTGTAYPLLPSGMFLFETFVDGMPSVILALQPNDRKIEGRFIREVLKRCLPSGVLLLLAECAVMIANAYGALSAEEYVSLSALALGVSGFAALLVLCFPFNKVRVGCVLFSLCGIVLCLTLGPVLIDASGASVAGIPFVNGKVLLVSALIFLVSIPLLLGIKKLFALCFRAAEKRRSRKKA